MTETLYTPAEAAVILRRRGYKVTERSVQRYCQTGALDIAGRAGRGQMYLIAASTLADFTPPRKGPKPKQAKQKTR